MADIIKWFLVEKEISCIIYNLTAILNFLWEAGKYFYAVFCVYERNTKCCFFYGIGNCSYSSGTQSLMFH